MHGLALLPLLLLLFLLVSCGRRGLDDLKWLTEAFRLEFGEFLIYGIPALDCQRIRKYLLKAHFVREVERESLAQIGGEEGLGHLVLGEEQLGRKRSVGLKGERATVKTPLESQD